MSCKSLSLALSAILAACAVSPFVSAPAAAQKTPERQTPTGTTVNVLTRQNDNQHTGQNLQETILTTANVNSGSFGKLFSYPVNGQIYAQPLYVQNVSIPSKGTHNVVYVATENDSVYAFDADSETKNPNPLWSTSFLNPPSVVGVPCAVGAGICQLFPIVGITGTPVINLANNTLYVVARTMETTAGVVTYAIRLHALNITTGAEQSGSPTLICSNSGNNGCTFPGQTVVFAPQHQQERPALLLVSQSGFSQGVLYMGFAGNSGWVLAYDASTLQLVGSFYTDSGNHGTTPGLPGEGHSGVWGAGGAITADTSGNIFAISGDGYFDGVTNWGDSLVKLVLTLNSQTGTYSLLPTDYFTPSDQACGERHTGSSRGHRQVLERLRLRAQLLHRESRQHGSHGRAGVALQCTAGRVGEFSRVLGRRGDAVLLQLRHWRLRPRLHCVYRGCERGQRDEQHEHFDQRKHARNLIERREQRHPLGAGPAREPGPSARYGTGHSACLQCRQA
jgi:hypothetical protein